MVAKDGIRVQMSNSCYCKKLHKALTDLYLLVVNETDLPYCAANEVTHDGLDGGLVRASEILENARVLVEEKHESSSC